MDNFEGNTMPEPSKKTHEKTSFLATMGAIFWSFIGLRRRSDYEKDVTGLNPFYVLIAALIGVSLFIGILLLVVSLALK
ncbi:conserved hypothetical protein; putative membrane protein [Herminiimonas arsenicoxydans]|uniref:DUF2970 domain-containing protein n=2 Tax=Herminiimonas TaxID=303379 RepID=A4G5R9_HERAR|nr:conserved hypothetical protein; putative membrane protein [Herminiimonas arsenicoxydans]